jgi:hypothetical protein
VTLGEHLYIIRYNRPPHTRLPGYEFFEEFSLTYNRFKLTVHATKEATPSDDPDCRYFLKKVSRRTGRLRYSLSATI